MRLSPVYPSWYLYNYGAARRLSGRPVEAKAAFEQVLQHNPDDGRARLDLALVQSKLGDDEAARQGIVEYLRRDPAKFVEAVAGDTLSGSAVTRRMWNSSRASAFRKSDRSSEDGPAPSRIANPFPGPTGRRSFRQVPRQDPETHAEDVP